MKFKQKRFFKKVWALSKGFWTSEQKWMALLLTGVIITLQVIYVPIMVDYNGWQKEFYNTIQQVDADQFFYYLKYWPIYMVVFICIEIVRDYLMQWLEIKWRTWLVHDYSVRYIAKRAYYLMQLKEKESTQYVDNPDQRITDDIRLFVNYFLTLTLGVLNAVLKLCSFTVVLWNLSGLIHVSLAGQDIAIPGYMVWIAIVYALVGSFFTLVVGKPMIGLNNKRQEYEANFRFGLARLREYYESIAFYKGETNEMRDALGRFMHIKDNFHKLMNWQVVLSFVTSLHWRVSFLFPYLVAVPLLFRGDIQFGGVFQSAVAFQQVENSLSFLVLRYYSNTEASIAQLQTIVNRLSDFSEHMTETAVVPEHELSISAATRPAYSLENISIYKPDGDVLIQSLGLTINAGEHVLIMGGSGNGKSTLLKTMIGIWPYADGRICMPVGASSLFLPQRPYFPIGTLREAVTYPYHSDCVTDTELVQALEACHVGYLKDKLDMSGTWTQILSPGEQQRVAFAKVLLYNPQWLFLDEATAALDEDNEDMMYKLIQQTCPHMTIISVGHHSRLKQYHTKMLCVEKGTYFLQNLS